MDLTSLDVSTVPALAEDQDEQLVLLVLRKDADSPNPDPQASAEQLVAMLRASGFDLEQSYMVTAGTDHTLASGNLAEFAAAVDAGEV